ncbi:hypothetical protein M422DRAFT_32438 [Sphaerobolus stellatus SS14]|uniref:BRO domain-containing protein 1 n=1 Tax=Sphaerobolus stellatus (strain SS14) TaxID=990650 RepID=A0A0C9UYS5_SPHS4|nr:hypothetical protein M422DRAFT_32438 [Sphaerobolus stellatus SS14]
MENGRAERSPAEFGAVAPQIAATHSAIASQQNWSHPEGLKRAFYYFRTAAGILTHINKNFLHAPSTDLSKDAVKLLVDIMIAQAHEVFYEKCRDEQKASALIAKVAAQTAALYTALYDSVKEFQGKKIFDHNWVTLLSIKAKYLTSLSQYYRAITDTAANKHGDALKAVKEAHSLTSSSFTPYFVVTTIPTLPSDAGTALMELTKAHLALCTEKRNEAQRDNDLIYNAVLPAEATLPQIDKAAVATPIPIQEVYGTPDVQKTIGPDLFVKLIPLSVHEAASVYSEEKAKIVRAEVEKADIADNEYRAALDSLGVKEGLGRYRAMVEGIVTSSDIVPREVRGWQTEIREGEKDDNVEEMLRSLDRLKENVQNELEIIGRDLEIESRDCEANRLKYEQWTQVPSSGLTKGFRQDLKAHLAALGAASNSDRQARGMWEGVREDVAILLDGDRLEAVFLEEAQGTGRKKSLLDMEDTGETDWQEREKICGYVAEIEERMGRLNKIGRERKETLKDLKEKVQSDDVSHLLLLNRRNSSVEPSLFSTELEKFKPFQARIASTIQYQQIAIQEIASFWKALKDLVGKGAGARKWEEKEKRKTQLVKRFAREREGWTEVKSGVGKGLQFYRDLTDLTGNLRRSVKSFVTSRASECDGLVSKLETERRFSSSTQISSPPPPRPAPPPSGSRYASPPPHPGQGYSASRPPPPPPPPNQQYSSSPYGSPSPYPPPPPQNYQQQQQPAYQQQPYQGYQAPPSQQQQPQYQYHQQQPQQPPPPPQRQGSISGLPPPPPPASCQQQYGSQGGQWR